jgi:N,N'-diacetylbacillosaminyl-diphospho-undecaprenol alpha-1,3-N-acetylgalactosaminyltransferase
VRFLLIGPNDDSSLDRLSRAELAQLKQVVSWSGPRRDIPVVLASSDIFVLPSAYREGIPRVLLEAASMGLPIVTTDSAGCNEVVEDSVNGLLVPVHDATALGKALLRLVADSELRARFGEASRRRALEHFDLSIVVEQTRSVYRRLLADRLPPADRNGWIGSGLLGRGATGGVPAHRYEPS